jgi:hypothetical protein
MRPIKHARHKYFKTGARLAALVDYMDEVTTEEFWNEFLQLHELDPDKEYQEVPYWLEIDPHEVKNEYALEDEYRCEVVLGYNDIELNTIRTIANTQYRYAYSVKLGEEQELQADDAKWVYVYHGLSFLRIWEPVAVKDENEVPA